jgi:hypothetical protein
MERIISNGNTYTLHEYVDEKEFEKQTEGWNQRE